MFERKGRDATNRLKVFPPSIDHREVCYTVILRCIFEISLQYPGRRISEVGACVVLHIYFDVFR